ncbi:hypothetical protein GCK72_020984 [Caenorhabditis remanei]|uniref:Uncharacterized protein n=1 Tax=Caenorhabditis remanei TaxID=31234 RepID=A0A6A5GIB6_CAERE|nr:hypothetical protein GCK72_020984 [Caenorhabditis remanei]KAF1754423.1 hypothetical protein GCK72_020984 [Caenorhabditis remanei]
MVLFFPSTEKYVTFNEDEVKRFIWSTYALGLIPIAMNYLQVPNVDVIRFFAFDILIATSAFLHIPIYIMLEKQKHLASAQLNKPHRYVMWQLIIIMICRLARLPIILLSGNIARATFECGTVDTVTTCLTIQLAYLGCCKRNLESLKSILLEKWWIRLLLCKCMNKNRVAAIERPINNLEVLQRL